MTGHSYRALVCTGMAALGIAPAANAQCEDAVPFNCSPPGSDRVSFVCTKPGELPCYDAQNPPPITPDRRSGFFLQMSASGRRSCENPLDQDPWWRYPNWNNLERQLDEAWAAGFRRIVLYKPGGNPGGQKVQQAQYEFLMDSQKDLLHNELGQWLAAARAADPDFDLGVVVGAWQSGGVCTPCLSEGKSGFWDCDDDDDDHGFTYNRRFMDPTSHSSMRETYQNLAPWIDTGCSSLWIDNASNRVESEVGDYKGPQRLVDLTQSPDYAGTKILGEAIPTTSDGYVDVYMAEHAAWFAHLQFLMGDDDGLPPGKGWLTGGSHDEQTVDPQTTELHALFSNPDGEGDGPPYTILTMADARDRGFIPWATVPDAIPLIQRLLDGEGPDGDLFYEALVTEQDIADFNADLKVDCDDFLRFYKNWAANLGSPTDPDLAVWDGDIDNDDTVTTSDMILFMSLHNWNSLGCF